MWKSPRKEQSRDCAKVHIKPQNILKRCSIKSINYYLYYALNCIRSLSSGYLCGQWWCEFVANGDWSTLQFIKKKSVLYYFTVAHPKQWPASFSYTNFYNNLFVFSLRRSTRNDIVLSNFSEVYSTTLERDEWRLKWLWLIN